MLIYRTHRVPTTGKGTITAHRSSSGPGFEPTDLSGGDGIARQRALVGDSLNDEQRSNDLSEPRGRIRQPVRRSQSCESTNLNLGEDGQEEIRNGVYVGAPRSNDQQRAHSIKGTRLNEHGNDGLAQPTDSV